VALTLHRLAMKIAGRKGALNTVFAGLIFVMATDILVRSLTCSEAE
jgi:hypothetical protein